VGEAILWRPVRWRCPKTAKTAMLAPGVCGSAGVSDTPSLGGQRPGPVVLGNAARVPAGRRASPPRATGAPRSHAPFSLTCSASSLHTAREVDTTSDEVVARRRTPAAMARPSTRSAAARPKSKSPAARGGKATGNRAKAAAPPEGMDDEVDDCACPATVAPRVGRARVIRRRHTIVHAASVGTASAERVGGLMVAPRHIHSVVPFSGTWPAVGGESC
jgi:hypothetical protein